jgi:hypothetical protein
LERQSVVMALDELDRLKKQNSEQRSRELAKKANDLLRGSNGEFIDVDAERSIALRQVVSLRGDHVPDAGLFRTRVGVVEPELLAVFSESITLPGLGAPEPDMLEYLDYCLDFIAESIGDDQPQKS